MEFCLFCKNKFVRVTHGYGLNKRRITQKVAKRNFAVVDVLKKLHDYKVVNISTRYKIDKYYRCSSAKCTEEEVCGAVHRTAPVRYD